MTTRSPTAPRSGRLAIIPAAAVFDSRLSRTDLGVLCALGAYANRSGRCWPATTTLAKDIRISTRMVRRCLRNLEDCGFLHTEHQKGQRSVYTVARGGADPGHPGSGVPRTYSDTTPDTQVPGLDVDPGHPGSGGADTQVPGTPDTQVPPKDTTKDTMKEKTHTVASLAGRQFDEFWRTYPSRRPHSNPKKPARAKFEAAVKRGVAAADIIRGAENYAAYVEREHTDPKYVTQAQTWLNQERWAQYQEAAVTEPTPLML